MYGEGKSAPQIATYFDVSVGAVYYSLKKRGVPRRTSRESNALGFESKPLSYDIPTVLTPEQEWLRFAAVMLYWAEGYKAGKQLTVDFTNSDPDMALLFRRFLSEVCHVNENRIRCFIYCFDNQSISELTHFWSNKLNIPISQFGKPYIKQAYTSRRGVRMIHGLVHIRYCDKKLLRQLLNWIDEYKLKCVGGGVVNRIGL